jgi:hypothetical protein
VSEPTERTRAPARVKSLCGTARKLKARNQKKLKGIRNPSGIPCRPSGIWACIGLPDRERRLATPRP